MIELNEFRKLLGKAAEGLSDEEVKRIRDLEYRIADVVFNLWLRERNKQTTPIIRVVVTTATSPI